MKKLFFFLAVLIVSAVLVAQFWLKPQIEAQIQQLISSIYNPNADNIEVKTDEINFSPFGRNLTIRNLEIYNKDSKQDHIKIEYVECHIPISVMFLFTPLADRILPASGDYPIINSFNLIGYSCNNAQHASNRIQNQICEDIALDANMLRNMLIHGQQYDLIDIFYALKVKSNFSENIRYSMYANQQQFSIQVGNIHIQDYVHRSIQSIIIKDVHILSNRSEVFHLDQWQENRITLPSQEQLRHLSDLLANPNVKQKEFEDYFLSLLTNQPPLFCELQLTGATIPMKEGLTEIKNLQFNLQPDDMWSFNVNGFSFPTSLVELNYGIKIPALPTIDIDFLLNVQKTNEAHARRQSGNISIKDLGNLQYGLTSFGENIWTNTTQTAFAAQYSDIDLLFEDHGLLARTSLLVSPNGQGEPILNSIILDAANGVVPNGHNIVQTLLDFVHQPGTLEIRSVPDKKLSFLQIMQLKAEDFDQYFSVSTTVGQESLSDQTKRLLGR